MTHFHILHVSVNAPPFMYGSHGPVVEVLRVGFNILADHNHVQSAPIEETEEGAPLYGAGLETLIKELQSLWGMNTTGAFDALTRDRALQEGFHFVEKAHDSPKRINTCVMPTGQTVYWIPEFAASYDKAVIAGHLASLGFREDSF